MHDIIGPLTRMDTPDLLAFTRMTGIESGAVLRRSRRSATATALTRVDLLVLGVGATRPRLFRQQADGTFAEAVDHVGERCVDRDGRDDFGFNAFAKRDVPSVEH